MQKIKVLIILLVVVLVGAATWQIRSQMRHKESNNISKVAVYSLLQDPNTPEALKQEIAPGKIDLNTNAGRVTLQHDMGVIDDSYNAILGFVSK